MPIPAPADAPATERRIDLPTSGPGDSTALDGHVFDGSDRWIEISVDGNTLDPRISRDKVPYAVRSTAATNATAVGRETAHRLQLKITSRSTHGNIPQHMRGPAARD